MKMPRPPDRGRIAGPASLAGLISACRRVRRVKHQRVAVHAIAQAGRLRSVVEDVAEMAAAAAAMHLRACHAKRPVLGGADGVVQRLIEAWPACAALELGLG